MSVGRNSEALPSVSDVPCEPKTVLVVDDDAYVARSVRRVLESGGFVVSTASDGAIAVDMLRTRSFDVIVSDIQMPGMSGVELLGAVRSYDLDVPVILMTGAPTVETAMEAVSLGALQYLPKPTPNDVVLSAVKRASRLHSMAQMKRDALQLRSGGGTEAGDLAGLRTRFDRALGSLWMAFQPVVDAAGSRVSGYEALLRSREPSLPHPTAVLDAAERLDRLFDLGRRVRALSAKAFEQAPPDTLLFINLHTRDLLDPELFAPDAPLTKLAHRVVLEITERSAIDNVKDIHSRVGILRAQGFRIAIDDLGAGYAGLSSFVALEPEYVKFDMSLVRNVHQSPIRQRLIGSMTALCKEMGMRVIAEGVELDQESVNVRGLGCDLLQGFYFAEPGPPFPTPMWPA